MTVQPCRLSSGGRPPYGSEKRAPTTIQWILHRDDTGAPLVLPDDNSTIDVNVSGEFAGAHLAIELSHDGVAYDAVASPIQSPRTQRINAAVKMLRPVVRGGGELTTIIVTLTASPR
jgi:hypothetical protein